MSVFPVMSVFNECLSGNECCLLRGAVALVHTMVHTSVHTLVVRCRSRQDSERQYMPTQVWLHQDPARRTPFVSLLKFLVVALSYTVSDGRKPPKNGEIAL